MGLQPHVQIWFSIVLQVHRLVDEEVHGVLHQLNTTDHHHEERQRGFRWGGCPAPLPCKKTRSCPFPGGAVGHCIGRRVKGFCHDMVKRATSDRQTL